MIEIEIRYEATYQYEDTASFSPHLVRLLPRNGFAVRTDRSRITTNEGTDVQYRQDIFDNLVAYCFYPKELDHLTYKLELDLRLEEKNPFHFLLASHALNVPFTYTPEEASVLSAYIVPRQPLSSIPAALDRPTREIPTVEWLVGLNSWLHENIEYERRDEGEAYAPEQTLSLMKGSCRDYSVLAVEVLRYHGLAARLVSGFSWEEELPEEDRRAENALHAWVETYLPGAGWVGLDPTNGIFCGHHFIATAVGLTPAHIAPVHGHYYGKKTINSTLTTNLSIRRK